MPGPESVKARSVIDRLRLARYRRSVITRQILDDRAEMELDFARAHIIRRAG